MKCRLKN